jgi:hypothetical protein
VQLVYFGNLSYYDVNMMTFKIRQFWLEEIHKILTEKARSLAGGGTDITSLAGAGF